VNIFQLPAELEGYRSLKDRTLKLSFETRELSPEQMANVHYALEKTGFLVFSADPFTTEGLKEIESIKIDFDDNGKTPSQKLKAVFYVLWTQKPEGYKIFNDFYVANMERLINHFKSKLEP
jgi:hypothetical protein